MQVWWIAAFINKMGGLSLKMAGGAYSFRDWAPFYAYSVNSHPYADSVKSCFGEKPFWWKAGPPLFNEKIDGRQEFEIVFDTLGHCFLMYLVFVISGQFKVIFICTYGFLVFV